MSTPFSGSITAPISVAIDRTYRNAGGLAYFIPTENEWYKEAYYDPDKSDAGVGGTGNILPSTILPMYLTGSTSGDTAFDAVFNDGYDQGEPNSVDNAGVLSVRGGEMHPARSSHAAAGFGLSGGL
ncbi:MAG: hypothetical protein ACYC0X_05635 [Pirellulaceae bacterium]